MYLTHSAAEYSGSVPQLVVSKWPNTKPTLSDIGWVSFDRAYQSLTISAWDPDLDGDD